jgi:cytochrome P450
MTGTSPPSAPFPPGFELGEQSFRRDPFPVYERLRAEGGIHQIGAGIVMFSRYREVMAALRNVGVGGDIRRFPRPWMSGQEDTRLFDLVRHMVPFQGQEYHDRLRRLLVTAFTPAAVNRMLPGVERVVERILHDVAATEEFDLVSQVGELIPAEVMCEMLDFPIEHRAWAAARVLGMSRTLDPDISKQEVHDLNTGVGEVEEFLLPLVRERRRHPGEDLMSALTQAQIDGELLSDTEIVANTMILFLAGQSTTRSLISNSVTALFAQPDQLDLLRASPDLDRPAAEEFLRFVGTIQMIGQRAMTDVVIGDTELSEGEEMFLVLASANRDEDVFPNADQLDITRYAQPNTPPTTAFGFGSHYCLGANLARMEVAAIVPALLRRFPDLELPEQELTYPGFSNRGPEQLLLRTHGGSAK